MSTVTQKPDWDYAFRDPAELAESVTRGWAFALCPPGKWLEIHACFSDQSVVCQRPTTAEQVINDWGYQLTDFQKRALQQFEQGVFVVRDYGCDVHPKLGTQKR